MEVAPAVAAQPVHRGEGQDEDDRFASPPGLWLPRTVVKKHRRNATIIWVSLLLGFLAYVAYIIWETIESRKDPASSIELKQQYYTFPDVALCSEFTKGCLDTSNDCFDDDADNYFMSDQKGFTNYYGNFTEDHRSATEAFEDLYPNCIFIPLSELDVDEEGVRNGSITSFSASFYVLWDEKGQDYDQDLYAINQQFLDMYLLEPGAPLESHEGRSVDAKVPYARLNLTTNTEFEAKINHMVLGLTEFIAINEHGNKEQKQRSFAQTTTTGIENWWWYFEGYSSVEVAILMVELSIGKFEFTSIEEVDPVDVWSIIGAIGGIWQFVVTGFGLFFVFSEKQSPDRKMRNFRKSVAKPAVVVNKRLSSLSTRSSTQDIEIDASAEDLPAEWVKKQRPNGSIYYFNVLTGAKQGVSPHDLVSTGGNGPHPRSSLANRVFQPAHNPSSHASDTGIPTDTAGGSGARSGDSTGLPPGWITRTDDNGRPYYVNTRAKTTQWERPTQPVHRTSSSNDRPPADHPSLAARAQRGTDPSSVHHPHSSSSGAPAHPRRPGGSAAIAANVTPPPPGGDAPPPPLGAIAALPSYRTAVYLSNNSTAASASGVGGDGGVRPAQQEEERRARAGRSSATAGAGFRGATTTGPPNWERRIAPNNKPYYVNNATKTTQWEAPHA